MPDATRRLGVVVAVVVAILGLAVAVSLQGTAPQPRVSADPIPSQSATPPPVASTIRSFRGFSVLPGEPAEPIGKSLQSRLWSIDGRWWAALVEPRTRETRIYELSADASSWTDTGVLIDERIGAVADTLWEDGHLYVATIVPGRATANGGRISRFSVGPDGRFTLDPNFPVRLTDGGLEAISIARDSTGRLWAAVVRNGQVQVAHSTTHEALWSVPERLPSQDAAVGPDDLAALVALDSGRLGVVWTQVAAETVSFASRADADPVDRWSDPEVAFDGLPISDNAISVAAAPGGRVAAAIETTMAELADPGQAAVQSAVVVRDGDGTWRRTLLSRVEDHLGPPTILVDAVAGQLHVFATSPRRGGEVYLKSADIERLEFPAGRGTLVVGHTSDPKMAVPTSTKQSVDLNSDFVVVAFDRDSGTYWHAVLGSIEAGGPSRPPPPSPSASAAPAPALNALVNDNFDPWPVDGVIGNGWLMRTGDPPGALTAVADATGKGRHARLRTAAASAVRACKSFAAVAGGTLVAQVRVQFDAIGPADVVISSLRDRSGEAASVRFGQGGTFAYYAGPSKVRTTVAFRPKTWYRSVLTVRPDKGTYDWVVRASDGSVLVRVERVPFRDAAATQVSSLCLQSSEGRAGLSLVFDDVVVSR